MNIYCRRFTYGSAIGCLLKVAILHFFQFASSESFLSARFRHRIAIREKGEKTNPQHFPPPAPWNGIIEETVLQVRFHSPRGGLLFQEATDSTFQTWKTFPRCSAKIYFVCFFFHLFVFGYRIWSNCTTKQWISCEIHFLLQKR